MYILPADQFAKHTIQTAVKEGYIDGFGYRKSYPDLFPDMPVYYWCCGFNCGGGGGGDDPIGVLVVAAIVAAFASIACTIKSIYSAVDGAEFNKQSSLASKRGREIKEDDPDKAIYENAEFLWKRMAQERTSSAISQFIMALGLMALTGALVIAIMNHKGGMHDANLASTLAIGGASGFGGGLLLYGITQCVKEYQRQNMQKAADRIKDRFVAMKSL